MKDIEYPRQCMDRNLLTVAGLTVMVLLLHLAQLASPLRLNTDACRLLDMALSAAEGHGYKVDGRPEQYPPGFPFIIVCLLKSGFGQTLWLNLISLLSIFGGAACFSFCLRYVYQAAATESVVFGLLPLLSWVVIKHEMIPLSDNMFFFLVQVCLLSVGMTVVTKGGKRFGWMLLAVLLALCGSLIRTAGISLFLMLFCVCMAGLLRRNLSQSLKRPDFIFWILCAALLTLCILYYFAVPLWQTQLSQKHSYVNMLAARLRYGDALKLYTGHLFNRLGELGQLVGNLGGSRVPIDRTTWIGAGVVALSLIIRGCIRCFETKTGAWWFMGIYTGLLLFWPYLDIRLMLPLLPLLLWFTYQGFKDLIAARHQIAVLRGVFGYWILTGVLALSYSINLSFSGDSFPDRYGNGTYRDSYRAAWRLEANPEKVIPRVVYLLKKFEPRAMADGNLL